MNNYSYQKDTPKGMSWWWLVGLLVAVWIAVTAGLGPSEPSIPPTSGTSSPCLLAVAPEDIHVWVDRLGGWANYDGTTGYWYDASGAVVGHSSAEDSDVCSYV